MSKPYEPMKSMDSGDRLEEQHRDAYGRWTADPSPSGNAAFLKHLQTTIDSAIRTHLGTSSPLLVSRARRMALDAVRTYDPKRSRLQTHLFNQLQSLKRVNRQMTSAVKVPERVSIDRYHLERYTRDLTDELGREPTDAELSDKTGFSPKRIAKVRTYSPAIAEGTLTANSEGNIYGGLDEIGSQRKSMWQEMVYADLGDQDRKIMELSLGLNGRSPLQNHQIARKLGRSPGLISQRKKHIQELLDQEPEMQL
jgi:DNA-directed RNA polymerase specialized sigma subunit